MDPELVQQFRQVTNASQQQAEFYLEANGGDLDVAIMAFFEGGANGPTPMDHESTPPPRAQPTAPAAGGGGGGGGGGRGAAKPPAGRIRTFGDIAQEHSDHSDDDGPDTNEYYAGGARNSGVAVKGKKTPKAGGDDVVEDVFARARENGARAPSSQPDAAPKAAAFEGAGFRLGSTANEPSMPLPITQKPKQALGPVKRVLTFWKTGFCIDDGPLRLYDDPANRAFLSDINQGIAPRELQPAERGREINIELVNKKHEDYKAPPKPPVTPFSGSGNTLGSTASAPPAATTTTAGGGAGAGTTTGSTENVVDESQPVTTLQIRLADGTRLVARFNHTALVGDVYTFCANAKRIPAGQSQMLMTPFPRKQLTDKGLTLEAADLLNATLVQNLS